ncbi:hypothetical protein F5883DRAFT_574341 [Diaporthe sp. PMI_573]|nr:hypothetical protein F5883DRAFT_574341 [Diaporthaceae sp. PMI_573]
MGHFDDCTPDQRFTKSGPDLWHETGTKKVIIDWDQRRFITVGTAWEEEDDEFFFCALAEHIDDIPSDVTRIEVGEHGELLKSMADPDEDQTKIPFYPSRSDYPKQVPQIRRERLVEISRMGVQVDLCEYASTPGAGLPPQQVAFKYYINEGNMAAIWDEGNCLLRMPKHSNIISFQSLIIDHIEGQDKVVGFTTPFIPGGTIDNNVSRPFKLKHLRQLTSTIDHLNLELDISHGDITPYNLLIDETTDNIIIFDFNLASRIGWEDKDLKTQDYDPARNDVKFAAFTLYEIITRDTHLRDENFPNELDIAMVLDTSDWEKHEDVVLDAAVEEYRRHLDEWIATRQADLGEGAKEEQAQMPTCWNQAPSALDWPSPPELPEVLFIGVMLRVPAQLRRELVQHGTKFLSWPRPPSCALPLPEGKKLLATGKVVELHRDV